MVLGMSNESDREARRDPTPRQLVYIALAVGLPLLFAKATHEPGNPNRTMAIWAIAAAVAVAACWTYSRVQRWRQVRTRRRELRSTR
jgi:hypothetical protein